MNTATARKLAPKVDHTPKKKTRTPLALVKYVPTQKIRRVPLPVLCAGIFGLSLCALLGTNIAISSAQYELASLKSKSNSLVIENQELSEQVRSYEAPQNLAASATKLGMVANQSTATINVDTITVTGTPKMATAEDSKGALLPAPDINSHYMVNPVVPASVPVEPSEPVAEPAVAQQEQTQESQNADEAPVSSETTTTIETESPIIDDYGSTVPAPAQRIPGE
jgi:hypothetical protein